MFLMNSAYAVSVGVCDALENSTSHTAHLGHHSHEHGDDHETYDADGTGKAPVEPDNHHNHVHQSFSPILPGTICVMSLAGCGAMFAVPASAFISALQALLDRPPKAVLA